LYDIPTLLNVLYSGILEKQEHSTGYLGQDQKEQAKIFALPFIFQDKRVFGQLKS